MPSHAELRRFEREYAGILCLQDTEEVFRRISAAVPRLTGLPVSAFGALVEGDHMVLRHTVNAVAFDGLTVPVGFGLGGRALLLRRAAWVPDYTTSDLITHHFNSRVLGEDLHGMVVAPIQHEDRLFGCLYAASRADMPVGDDAIAALQLIADRAATAAVTMERTRRFTEAAIAEERHRVALELHDTVGASLFTIQTGVRRLGEIMDGHEDAAARARTLGDQVGEASMALRRSMRVLSASADEIGLSVALREDCRAFEERTGTPTRLILLTAVPRLPPAVTEALTRAAREALLNVEKHADARSVIVTVFTAQDRLVLAVSDDGVGLAADRVAGLGLAATGDRLGRLGGDVMIGPGEDGGVTAQAWVPLPHVR